MSFTGSLLTYENNNHVIKKLKKHNSNICSSDLTQSVKHYSLNSVSKTETSLKSSVSKSNLGVALKQQETHPHFKAPHFQTSYMNSKRKHSKFSNTYGRIHPDNSNSLHLNSLWSIWYGVLLTLFQAYLAIHGASRFLGCSLIPWKIEPVTELNLQIILSGLVFVLLPFFFTSAVFKVGNVANDGIKLASASKDRTYPKIAHAGFGEESHIGSMKILWVHGGPTAAFIHILIALCLLLPRLLLEGRIIENGFLPRETIWQTELDFMLVNRNNLVVLSIKSSQYRNNTLIESVEDENVFNDSIVDVPTKIQKTSINLLHSNISGILVANGKKTNEEFLDLTEVTVAQNDSSNFLFFKKSTVSPFVTSHVTDEDVRKASVYKDNVAVTFANMTYSNSTENIERISKNENKLISLPAHLVSYNTYHNIQNNHNGKKIRKHRQGKLHQQFHSYKKNGQIIRNQKNLNFDFVDIGTNKIRGYNENNSNGILNYVQNRPTYLKFPATTSSAIKDSDIHIVKQGKLPKIVPSTAVSSNSNLIEITQKTKRATTKEASFVEVEPQLVLNESSEYIAQIDLVESYITSKTQPALSDYNIVHLDGFAGMLQLVFDVKKPIDVKAFINQPSAEFLNLLFALLVWCVRYPAVFWATAKSFATIFSVQMIVSAADIIFSYVGISSLFKLQIYNQGHPVQNQGLILNASVTLALFLLSVVLILSSSMVLYLFGHGRLSAKMRDRSIITLSSNNSWIYFAHCSSLSYILALSVVKAPLLNDLSATYRDSLHCPTFVAALVSVMHILLWIVIWMVVTFKSKWGFKLPPLDTYTLIGKATTKSLLPHNRRSLTNTTPGTFSNSTNLGISSSASSVNTETNLKCGNTNQFLTNTSTSNVLNDAHDEDIYWPNRTPSSPKLKVTFSEVTSAAEGVHHHRLFDEHQENNKR